MLGGGKFANGAITGAFQRLFNHEIHPTGLPPSEGGGFWRSLARIVGKAVGSVISWIPDLCGDTGGTCGASGDVAHQKDVLKTWGKYDTLERHFLNHGNDFNAVDMYDYAEQAHNFYHQSGVQAKVDSDGVLRLFDSATNTFGAYNADGTTRTFFKPPPKRAQRYFDRQAGTPVVR